jgi:hypothetical protein
VAHVLDGVDELLGAAQHPGHGGTGPGGDLHSRVPGGARADEQAHLDAALVAERHHLADVGIGEQHHAAPLADPVHPDPVLVGRGQHRPERLGTLDRRDLEVVGGAVWEPLGGGRQLARVPVRQAHAPKERPRRAARRRRAQPVPSLPVARAHAALHSVRSHTKFRT